MSYLARLVQRFESGAEASPVSPAMPSRSPLAAADQRLNLDGFAAQIPPPPSGDGPLADPDHSFGEPGFDSAVERTSQPTTDFGARGEPSASPFQDEGAAQDRSVQPASPQSKTAAPTASPSPEKPEIGESFRIEPLPETLHSDRRDRETTPGSKPGPTFTTAFATTNGNAEPPTSERTERAQQLETLVPQSLLDDPFEPSSSPEALPNVGPLNDALRRAAAWVEAGAEPTAAPAPFRPERRRADDRQLTTATPVAPPPAPPARHTRAAATVEIGTIEIEILPPPSAPRTAAQRSRPAPRSAPPRPARAFGWRQR